MLLTIDEKIRKIFRYGINNSDMAICPKTLDLLEIFGAEVMGTAFLLFFGCVGLLGSLEPNPKLDAVQPALVWAFTVTACVLIFAPLSGAHMNPAVTLCALIYGKISLVKGFVYLLAECVGSFIGIWLVKMITPCDTYPDGFCTTKIHTSVSLSGAFLSEFLGTSFLIYAVCSAWDPRSERHLDSMPIKFGFTVGTIVFGLGHFSGASLNPARSLGPAMLNGTWDNQWLYWIAPLCASAVTTLLYKYTFLKKYHQYSKRSPQSTNENLMMS